MSSTLNTISRSPTLGALRLEWKSRNQSQRDIPVVFISPLTKALPQLENLWGRLLRGRLSPFLKSLIMGHHSTSSFDKQGLCIIVIIQIIVGDEGGYLFRWDFRSFERALHILISIVSNRNTLVASNIFRSQDHLNMSYYKIIYYIFNICLPYPICGTYFTQRDCISSGNVPSSGPSCFVTGGNFKEKNAVVHCFTEMRNFPPLATGISLFSLQYQRRIQLNKI